MDIRSRVIKYRSGLAAVLTIILGSLPFVFVYPFSDNKKLQISEKLSETAQDITPVVYTNTMWPTDLPICKGNLLDQREFHYQKEVNEFFYSSRLMSETGPCRLRRYTVEHAVTCFDVIDFDQDRFSQKVVDPIRNRHQELRFVFMGDSRMRQQFLNFIRLIPDYDQKSLPNAIPLRHHGDIEITSNILRVRISFKWRPLINDYLMKTVHQWITTDLSKRPHWILLSMTAWHMMKKHGADPQLYQNKLIELGPLLGQLANVSQVIWLHQYPTIDFYARIGAPNAYIVSEKIHGYNKITRHILESLNSRIRIWDSSNPLAEEYVRDCTTLKRNDNYKINYASSYFICDDYIHTGYSALSQATQLLFNDICNNQMEYMFPSTTMGL